MANTSPIGVRNWRERQRAKTPKQGKNVTEYNRAVHDIRGVIAHVAANRLVCVCVSVPHICRCICMAHIGPAHKRGCSRIYWICMRALVRERVRVCVCVCASKGRVLNEFHANGSASRNAAHTNKPTYESGMWNEHISIVTEFRAQLPLSC